MTITNGNATINITTDGTRVIEYENDLKLEYPLNIDIRVSNKCAFGYNPKTNKAICSFCHESATTDGIDCNYGSLKEILKDLPKGIELAIGSNEFTKDLYNFLSWCYDKQFICNVTVNQGHVIRDLNNIVAAINDNYIKGLGISYRPELKWNIPKVLLDYNNTVFHVIAGIDTIEQVISLKDKSVSKILILGEKSFGFNEGNVNLNSKIHKEWFWYIHKLFSLFDIVSFDNLALQQLNIQRFFLKEDYEVFNQGEYSFYIDATKEIFKPSSRNNEFISWNNLNIKEYFKLLTNN